MRVVDAGVLVDRDTARFLDAQDEAVGIPKDSRDSWRAGRDGVARVSPTTTSTDRKSR